MSDALTDIARDERRGRHYRALMNAIAEYLEVGDNFSDVVEEAEATDAVPSGYWGGRTKLAEGIREQVRQLREGDERVWGTLLLELAMQGYGGTLYYRFKRLSPWSDKLLIHIDYSYGFESIYSPDLHNLVEERGFQTKQADDYTVALNIDPDQLGDVVWLRRDRFQPQEPNTTDRKPQQWLWRGNDDED